ncbi:MAG: hypothetical protein WC823_01325 [Parcubacteria group bacterium]|jgi:hypothetical protein
MVGKAPPGKLDQFHSIVATEPLPFAAVQATTDHQAISAITLINR